MAHLSIGGVCGGMTVGQFFTHFSNSLKNGLLPGKNNEQRGGQRYWSTSFGNAYRSWICREEGGLEPFERNVHAGGVGTGCAEAVRMAFACRGFLAVWVASLL